MILDAPLLTRRLSLRTLASSDASEAYRRWLNDRAINRFLESRFRQHTLEDIAQFIAACNADPKVLLLGIITKSDARHIGNIKLGPIDANHGLGDIGLLIGEPDHWGQGYAREAILALTDHALGPLGLHKITASCYASNVGSRRAFEACGFIVEGTRPKHFRSDGRWEDSILMARMRDDA